MTMSDAETAARLKNSLNDVVKLENFSSFPIWFFIDLSKILRCPFLSLWECFLLRIALSVTTNTTTNELWNVWSWFMNEFMIVE